MNPLVGKLDLPTAATSYVVQQWEDAARELVAGRALAHRVPGADVMDPWCDESLLAAEAELLRLYPNQHVKPPPLAADDYMQFLGEGLIHEFGGQWVLLRGSDIERAHTGDTFGFAYKDLPYIDPVFSMVEIALTERTGTWWLTSFVTMREFVAKSALQRPDVESGDASANGSNRSAS